MGFADDSTDAPGGQEDYPCGSGGVGEGGCCEQGDAEDGGQFGKGGGGVGGGGTAGFVYADVFDGGEEARELRGIGHGEERALLIPRLEAATANKMCM